MSMREGAKTDSNGVTDSGLLVQLNGDVIQGQHTLPAVPTSPVDTTTAKKSEWEEYAVALGLDPALAATWSRDDLITWCG